MAPPWRIFSITSRRPMNGAPSSSETEKPDSLIVLVRLVRASRVAITRRASLTQPPHGRAHPEAPARTCGRGNARWRDAVVHASPRRGGTSTTIWQRPCAASGRRPRPLPPWRGLATKIPTGETQHHACGDQWRESIRGAGQNTHTATTRASTRQDEGRSRVLLLVVIDPGGRPESIA